MGDTSNTEFPYKSLGIWLRRMRLKRQESLAEVSGAVEIDVSSLADMEKGARRPSEDILMLLISYFSISEEESVKLWELAGYEPLKEAPSVDSIKDVGADIMVQPVIVVPMEARIVYTDQANIEANKYGVTINFLQNSGAQGKSVPVSRVGMSRDHAEKLLKILQKELQSKQLPSPKEKPDENNSAAN